MLQLEYINKSKGDKNQADILDNISSDFGEDNSQMSEIETKHKCNSIIGKINSNTNSASIFKSNNIIDVKKNLQNFQKLSITENTSSLKISQNNPNALSNKNKSTIKLIYENQNINLLKFSQDSFEKLKLQENEKETLRESEYANDNYFLAKKHTFTCRDSSKKNLHLEKEEEGHLNFAKIFNQKMSINYLSADEHTTDKKFNMNTIHVFPRVIQENALENEKSLKTVRNKSITNSIDFMHSTNSENNGNIDNASPPVNPKFFRSNLIKKSSSMTTVTSFVDKSVKFNKPGLNYNKNINNEKSMLDKSDKNYNNISKLSDTYNKQATIGNKINYSNNTAGERLKNLQNFNTNVVMKDIKKSDNIKSKIDTHSNYSNFSNYNTNIKSPPRTLLKSPPSKVMTKLIEHKTPILKKAENKHMYTTNTSKNAHNLNMNIFNKPKKSSSDNSLKSEKINNENLLITSPINKKEVRVKILQQIEKEMNNIKNTTRKSLENQFDGVKSHKNILINSKPNIKETSSPFLNLNEKIKVNNILENSKKTKIDYMSSNNNQNQNMTNYNTKETNNSANTNFNKSANNFYKNKSETGKNFVTGNENKTRTQINFNVEKPVVLNSHRKDSMNNKEQIEFNKEKEIKSNLDAINRNKEMKVKKIMNEFIEKKNEDNYLSFIDSNRSNFNNDRKISINKKETQIEEPIKKNGIFINLNKNQVKSKNSGYISAYTKNLKKSI